MNFSNTLHHYALITLLLPSLAFAGDINKELSVAIVKGDNTKIKQCIERGADPLMLPMPALHRACGGAALNQVKFLVESNFGVDVMQYDQSGRTAFTAAIYVEKRSNQDLIELCTYLMSKGLKIEQGDRSALCVAAARENRTELLKFLLTQKHRVKDTKAWQAYALGNAMNTGNTKNISLLLAAEKFTDRDIVHAFEHALTKQKFYKVLIDAGLSPATRNEQGETALTNQVKNQRVGNIGLFLRSGVELDLNYPADEAAYNRCVNNSTIRDILEGHIIPKSGYPQPTHPPAAEASGHHEQHTNTGTATSTQSEPDNPSLFYLIIHLIKKIPPPPFLRHNG